MAVSIRRDLFQNLNISHPEKSERQAGRITSMRGEKRDEASELRKRELFDDVRQCAALTKKRSFSFSANEAS